MPRRPDTRGHESVLERGEDDSYRGVHYADIVAVRWIGRAVHLFTHEDLSPRRVVLEHDSAAEASRVAERVQYGVNRVARNHSRPRRLLLVVNPAAGDGRSRRLVSTFLRPFFRQLAGVDLTIIETREGFGEDGLRDALRERFDGYVAVGGDGVFGYLVNTLRDVFDSFPAPLAHIPTGSTDAVACTITSRAPFASAMCTALSRRAAIDYLEVSTVCRDSIRNFSRLGPLCNDVAGFIALLRNRSIRDCDIRYAEPVDGSVRSKATDCSGAACERCRMSDSDVRSEPEASWKSLRGDFLSVMILNHSCKSDKTPLGMLRRAHSGDGIAYLVCVRKCNPLRYLLFLLSMSLFGLRTYDRRIVEIVPVVEVEVRGPSVFNVDGELVTAEDGTVRIKVVPKGLPVFAR